MGAVEELERPASKRIEVQEPPAQKVRFREVIGKMVNQAERVITTLQDTGIHDDGQTRKKPKFYSVTAAANLIGKSTQAIRAAESAGTFPEPAREDNGRRAGYTLADVNRMRRHYDLNVGRTELEQAVRMSFQNFKGGVGKTTLTCHFAQYLAERGYRVLLIDADSQASSTMTFGWQPDVEIDVDETLYPFLCGQQADLHYAIRKTHWDQLDLIPANLDLYSAEYHLASVAGAQDDDETSWIDMLSIGIATVEHNYDVVLIDAPPALGMVSLNVLRSLTGLIIPAPAAMMDFHSTATFLRMLDEVLGQVADSFGEELEFDFFKILISKFDTTKPAQDFVAKLTGQQFGDQVLQKWFVQSAEIDNASAQWQTVYELEKATGSAKTYKRCIESMNSVFAEVEEEVRGSWPSHHAALRGMAQSSQTA